MLGGATRLSMWMTRYPYVQESLRTQEFTDLELPEDLALDADEERIVRRGLVRVYYQWEFDAEEMRALAQGARKEFAADHGEMPNGRTALAVLGAAGRREFATGAPLRLLFLYAHDPVPDGVMSLSPEDWHEQLLLRLMLLVRNLSPEKILYDLQPVYPIEGSGACSLHALRQHFSSAVAPADLRMLTSARVIHAEGDLADAFAVLRHDVLARSHDLAAIAADISTVRHTGPQRGDTFSVTGLAGGLADVELAAEYLELAGAAPESGVPALRETFEAARERSLLEGSVASDLIEAASLWQNLDGFLRMTRASPFDPQSAPDEQKAIVAEMCGVTRFEMAPARIDETASRTATHLAALWSALSD